MKHETWLLDLKLCLMTRFLKTVFIVHKPSFLPFLPFSWTGVNHDIAVEVALLNDSYLFQVKKASQNVAAPSHKNGTTPCQETINQGGLFELLSLPGRNLPDNKDLYMAVVTCLKISNCKWSLKNLIAQFVIISTGELSSEQFYWEPDWGYCWLVLF